MGTAGQVRVQSESLSLSQQEMKTHREIPEVSLCTYICTKKRPFEDLERKQPTVGKRKTSREASRSWTSSLQNFQEINVCCLHHLVRGILSWQPEQTSPSSQKASELPAASSQPPSMFTSVSGTHLPLCPKCITSVLPLSSNVFLFHLDHFRVRNLYYSPTLYNFRHSLNPIKEAVFSDQ